MSAGNAAMVTVADYLDFYGDDDATAVALAYVEGLTDGRAFMERLRGVAARKPVVLLKGGATSGGQRAAASHTGSLATDDRVFDGACRQAGVTRAATVEEARAITRRYIAPEEVEGYVAEWTDLRTIVRVIPDRIVSWSAGG